MGYFFSKPKAVLPSSGNYLRAQLALEMLRKKTPDQAAVVNVEIPPSDFVYDCPEDLAAQLLTYAISSEWRHIMVLGTTRQCDTIKRFYGDHNPGTMIVNFDGQVDEENIAYIRGPSDVRGVHIPDRTLVLVLASGAAMGDVTSDARFVNARAGFVFITEYDGDGVPSMGFTGI